MKYIIAAAMLLLLIASGMLLLAAILNTINPFIGTGLSVLCIGVGYLAAHKLERMES